MLNDAAMYTLYISYFIVPYLNYCCEIWGNNFNSITKPLFSLQTLKGISNSHNRVHTNALFFQFKKCHYGYPTICVVKVTVIQTNNYGLSCTKTMNLVLSMKNHEQCK